MADVMVVFDAVWKKYRRGERHDSLRDLIPAALRRTLGARRAAELEEREFWALRDVSFEVGRGEALGIIGPNGAGKSTTLKLLTRILRPTRGVCAVRGRVGALIEVAAGFHPDLTGRENVFLQGAIMGMRRADIQRKLDTIVEFAGIGEFIDTQVKRYSSGMNARLGFSIAAHLDPDVLIIDEVLSVGDLAFQNKCFRRMETFLRNGTAIVLVSHNLQAVSDLCRRAVLLDHGAVAAAGDSADVIASYCAASAGAERETRGKGATLRVHVPGQPREGEWRVRPGTTMSLHVDVMLEQMTRSGVIRIIAWDMARNLDVYEATSESIGIPRVAGSPGHRVSYRFDLDVNLARGLYAVEVNLFDVDRQQPLAVLRPAVLFSVDEHTTRRGIANLYLRGCEAAVQADTEAMWGVG